MMASTRSTRAIKKIEKPKPLKIIPPSRHSSSDVPGQISVSFSSEEDILGLLEAVSTAITRKNSYDEIGYHTATLIAKMKIFGSRLEENYKDQLDKVFGQLRNGSKDDSLEYGTRMNLLHLVELRAEHYNNSNSAYSYYSAKSHIPEVGEVTEVVTPVGTSNVLSPGEILKSSGKYSVPTKVPGKNYFKDEVVIRNSDSGKVMGIKGRRVHMIEELSETVISFQRVSPGAKERNVQITGPEEEKINLAKQLIEDTIKRNASPIREVEKDIGSNSSLNSTASDDSALILANNNSGKMVYQNSIKEDLYEYEYKHSVVAGGKTIKLSSNNHDWLKWAKLVLETAAKQKETDVLQASKQTQTLDFQNNNRPAYFNAETSAQKVSTINDYENAVDNTMESTKTEVNEPVKKSVLQKKPSVVKLIQYTREFLLDLSSCKAATKHPPDWDKICLAYPNIVKQDPVYFDAALYTKKWLENEGKSVQLDANLEYFDSE